MKSEVRVPRSEHLDYIDGLRGFCALYIVMHHLALASGYLRGGLLWFFGWGGYCVAVFITISGFCLMLPVARAGNHLRGGASVFLKKRARRILPPYYSALLLSVLFAPLFAGRPGLYSSMLWRSSPLSLVLHLALLHNWFEQSKYTFNGPLWSVAVECQIYVVFPLLVILWRKLSPPLCVLLVAGITIPASVLLGYHGNLHYVLLFTFGMLGADIANGQSYNFLSKSLILPAVACLVVGNLYWSLLGDLSISVITTIFLCCGMSLPLGRAWRFFTLKPLRALGLYSYSIYLIHSLPLMYVSGHRSALASWDPLVRYCVLALAVVPPVLGLAYLFFLAFEKPFMSRHQRETVMRERMQE